MLSPIENYRYTVLFETKFGWNESISSVDIEVADY